MPIDQIENTVYLLKLVIRLFIEKKKLYFFRLEFKCDGKSYLIN